jgi:hypothetical protein
VWLSKVTERGNAAPQLRAAAGNPGAARSDPLPVDLLAVRTADKQRVDAITADIATVQNRIEAQLGELAPAVARLDAIPAWGRSPHR